MYIRENGKLCSDNEFGWYEISYIRTKQNFDFVILKVLSTGCEVSELFVNRLIPSPF